MPNFPRITLLALLVTFIGRRCSANQKYGRDCGGIARHVHLAVGPEPSTSMTVSFASHLSQNQAPVAGVRIGTSDGNLDRLVIEEEPASCYNVTNDATSTNTPYYSPFYHHVTIENLQPATEYYYKLEVHATLDMFDEEERRQRRHLKKSNECPSPYQIRSFTTAPEPGPNTRLTLAVMGDLGHSEYAKRTISSILNYSLREPVHAMILGGDIAYTSNDPNGWDYWFDLMDDLPVAASVPLMVSPGNHDIEGKPDGSIYLDYEHRFRMPRVKPPQLGLFKGRIGMNHVPYPLLYEYGNSYYAYTHGPARMIMLNPFSSMEPHSTQYKWLCEELQTIDRTRTPWVIVTIHTPLYTTFEKKHLDDLQMAVARQNLEPLFVAYSVNVVFSGHVHAYLRTSGVAYGEPNVKGPIYIIAGATGHHAAGSFSWTGPEAWVQVRDATYFGHGMLRIQNATHAVWSWVHTARSYTQTCNLAPDDLHPAILNELPAVDKPDSAVISNQYFL